tara:strand:- start:411 stop:665 length:255 start_codon:yes stop_codon:yes gene_type:complete
MAYKDQTKLKRAYRLRYNDATKAIYGNTHHEMHNQEIVNLALTICDMYGQGIDPAHIARDLNVSKTTVFRHARNRNVSFGWKTP